MAPPRAHLITAATLASLLFAAPRTAESAIAEPMRIGIERTGANPVLIIPSGEDIAYDVHRSDAFTGPWTRIADDAWGAQHTDTTADVTVSGQGFYRLDDIRAIETPVIASISPHTVGNSGPVQLTLCGSGLAEMATVTLISTGESDIVSAAIIPGSVTDVAATLELAGAAAGVWSVTAENQFGRTGTRPDALTIDANPFGGHYDGTDGLSDTALTAALRAIIDDHFALGFAAAEVAIFEQIDPAPDGFVRGVYTGEAATDNTVPVTGFATTFTWPEIRGATVGPAHSDLHHLFPAVLEVAAARSNLPFSVLTSWTGSRGGSVWTVFAFQPRPEHRGDCARAMFYFAVRYDHTINTSQENDLRLWHIEDPVSATEIDRNEAIFTRQGNRNPFIDRPDFVDRISDFVGANNAW